MQKKTTMCKKDDRQNRFFIASKGAGLSSDIWTSRKALKGYLQNIYLILDLLYLKDNLLTTTVVDDNIFKKVFMTIIDWKMLEEDITFNWLLQWWNYN